MRTQTKYPNNIHHSDHAPSLAWPEPSSELSLGTSRHIPPLSPASPLTRSTGRDRSSLSSSQAGRPRACDPSCASAWMRGWGSTPGRWCTGRVTRRCGCAGAWSWPNSLGSAGGTACTRTASHLRGKKASQTTENGTDTLVMKAHVLFMLCWIWKVVWTGLLKRQWLRITVVILTVELRRHLLFDFGTTDVESCGRSDCHWAEQTKYRSLIDSECKCQWFSCEGAVAFQLWVSALVIFTCPLWWPQPRLTQRQQLFDRFGFNSCVIEGQRTAIAL